MNGNLATQNTCTFKTFQAAKPPTFDGSKGATALLQWFESMKSTFLHTECPDDKKTRFASSVFEKTALTWWNKEKNTRGVEVAMALPWQELKDAMTDEFCPPNELQNLEDEFWKLKQEGGDNITYTTRFHELSLLVPHIVTPLKRAINKYIQGLPRQIQDSVLSSKPKELSEAITLAATLSDNHVKAGTLTRKGTKNPTAAESSKTDKAEPSKADKTEPSIETTPKPQYNNNSKKRKHNFALTHQPTPLSLAYPPQAYQPQPYQPQLYQIQVVQPPPPLKKPYLGNHPFCQTCQRHHPIGYKCIRCSTCGRFGHQFYSCPTSTQANPAAPHYAPTNPTIRACYNCGDPNHFRNNCPNLVGQIQAYPNQANQLQVYQAQAQINQVPNDQAHAIQPQPNQNLILENRDNQGAQGRVNHNNANEFQLRNHGTATR